ncbi:uncharacterized transporter slc-17.2-like-like [Octopus vulgaris]|uniref:Uncharacterized transporter slc-17.2-like-like n=1 Tax=Octopus vulgaris TaxID=6645 RepID=A0AA36BUD2_OCTVU|nr:uncharacterized transporter slc-17.2-like-like [Octopus vulgaris]
MLAGYFYGFIMSNIVGGFLADKYGGKRVVAGSLILASILSVLHPSLSRISGYITLVLRILTGMVSGPIYPAIHSIFRRWGPPQEIGSLIGFSFAGQFLGTFIGHSVSGYLCVYGFDNGWGSIFYVFGSLSLAFSCVWCYFVYDNPDTHPTITDEERSYLNTSITNKKAIKNVPWKKLFSSPAVWAINFAKFANKWMQTYLQVLLPLYMNEALKIEITSNGLMSSANSIGQVIALPLCGNLADFVLSKKYVSTRCVRVLFQDFSLILPGCLLIAVTFLRCDQTVLISFLLFLCGVTMSFVCGGVYVNNKDIAPKYAGIVYGIANTFGTIASSICPLSTKALTPNGTKEEWQIVFALLAAICLSGAILYTIFARGEIQDWARSEESGPSVNHSDTQSNKIA